MNNRRVRLFGASSLSAAMSRRSAQRPVHLSVQRPARIAAVALFATIGVAGSNSARAGEALASPWVEGHNVRTRLLAGRPSSQDLGRVTAGVEIDMADGWKTYWRNPGDAGGVPPSFDWSRSENIAKVTVEYPAPKRLVDKAGTTIGYKGNVVFPVTIEVADAAKPVSLRLDFAFGTCREICVPGEAGHEIEVPSSGAASIPQAVIDASVRVPGPPAADRPRLEKTEANLAGTAPTIILHAAFPVGAENPDLFVEGPEGEFVPIPQFKAEGATGVRVYEIDLTQGADIAALKGKDMLVTLVSSKGSSEVRVPIE